VPTRTVPLSKSVTPVAIVTAAPVEIVIQTISTLRMTQLPVEVVATNIAQARVTQLPIEVVIPKSGGARTVGLSFKPAVRSGRSAPLAGSFRKTSGRTVALSAGTKIGRRTVPLTFRVVTHPQRLVSLTTRSQRFAQSRTVSLVAKLGLLGRQRTVPLLAFTSGVGPPWTRSQSAPLRTKIVSLGRSRTVPLTKVTHTPNDDRTVPLSARIGLRHPRTVPLTTRVVTHPRRLVPFKSFFKGNHFVPLSSRLKKVGSTRTVPLTGRVKRTGARTVPLTGRTKLFASPRTVALSMNVTYNVLYRTPKTIVFGFVGIGTQIATVAYVRTTLNTSPLFRVSEVSATTTAAVSATDTGTVSAGLDKGFSTADTATESEAARKRVDEPITVAEQASIKLGGVSDPATESEQGTKS
jgi:hypothetical protein